MIVLSSLMCPNGHPVTGQPHEFPGTELPPEQWSGNINRAFWQSLPKYPPEALRCVQCGLQFEHGKTKGWYVEMAEMKARTMDEALKALQGCLEFFDA